MSSSGRQPQYMKWNIAATNGQILLKFETEAIGIKPECTKVSNEDDLQRKTTSKYEKWNISSTTGWILLKFETEAMGSNQSVQRYQMKTTSSGRRPQNMESGISQQPLVGSYSNLKLKLI